MLKAIEAVGLDAVLTAATPRTNAAAATPKKTPFRDFSGAVVGSVGIVW